MFDGLLDDFNRADESPLNASLWESRRDAANTTRAMRLVSNEAAPEAANSIKSFAIWTGFSTSGDVFARAKIAHVDDFSLVFARVSGNSSNKVSGYAVQAYSAGISIEKITNSDFGTTQLAATSATIAAGDEIAIYVHGTTIEAWLYQSGTWTQKLSVTDSTYTTGKIGIGQGTGPSSTSGRLDDAQGGAVTLIFPPFISSATAVYTPDIRSAIGLPFISTATVVYALELPRVEVPFIASATVVYPLTLPRVELPFISSHTTVYRIFSVFPDETGLSGAGNGGELFDLELAPSGTSITATLAASVTPTGTLLTLTGDTGLPDTFVLHLTGPDEYVYVLKLAPGSYRMILRGLSNTAAAAHSAGETATWTDTYDMAILSTERADATVDDGLFTHTGWVIAFDSTQGRLLGDRYATRVEELVGVFSPDTGTTGNKLDSTQPTAVSVGQAVTDDCPAGMTVPALIEDDIVVGDVVVCRYVNVEDEILTLTSRSVAAQTWYGFKRMSDDDTTDVTFTDPDGNIVDGTVSEAWFDPVDRFTTTTLPGIDRFFTYGPPRYSEKGWPIAALAVRQDDRRVPYWESPDWHNFNFVYSGFGADATYVQVLINRNGFDPVAPLPTVDLPGPQDIDGPNATWDDGDYFFGTGWYVALFKDDYILTGPTLNPGGAVGGGGPGGGGGGGGAGGVVSFPPTGPPTVEPPNPEVEGGSGGGIGVGQQWTPHIYNWR